MMKEVFATVVSTGFSNGVAAPEGTSQIYDVVMTSDESTCDGVTVQLQVIDSDVKFFPLGSLVKITVHVG